MNGNCQFIAGERRWRAHKLAKMVTISEIMKSLDHKESLITALIQNIYRL